MLEAFVVNFSKYNEGNPRGAWLSFPTTKDHVQALLKILRDNDKTHDTKNLLAVLGQVSAMERQLATAVEELKNMRGELNAMRDNHPLRDALQTAVRTMDHAVTALRERLAVLKQNVISGCRNAVAAFKEKGISALANLADFFKLRPALEAIGRRTDEAIRADNQAIAKIEAASTEYHESGRHFKNIFRSMAGKEPIAEAKPVGNIAKALEAPYKAERAALRGIRKSVNAALSGLSKLEQARPIKEQFADAAKEAAAANASRAAPGRARDTQVDR